MFARLCAESARPRAEVWRAGTATPGVELEPGASREQGRCCHRLTVRHEHARWTRGDKSKPGSCEHAAEVAARAFLAAGATLLGVKLAAYVASFGGVNWQTDVTVQRAIVRPDGKPYHVESIGRVRRELDRRGWFRSLRVHPGQRPHDKAKFTSSHGTTAKSIIWSALGVRNPMRRGDRVRARASQEKADKPELSARPRYSAPAPLERESRPVPGLPADLQRAIERAERSLEESGRFLSRPRLAPVPSSPSGADPPD